MQRTLKNIEIKNQNLYGSQTSVNCITTEDFSKPSVLHQVRDQTSPGPGLTFGCNTFRDNNGRRYYSEVNNQNLPGFYLTKSSMNTAVVGVPNYQPLYCSDKVLNSYRVGLDLTTQEDQGEPNSNPIISQFGINSRTEPSNADYQPMYCSDKDLNPYRVGLDLSTQEDQGELNSCTMISQIGAGARAEPSNIDYQPMYCSDKVLNPYRVRLNLNTQEDQG